MYRRWADDLWGDDVCLFNFFFFEDIVFKIPEQKQEGRASSHLPAARYAHSLSSSASLPEEAGFVRADGSVLTYCQSLWLVLEIRDPVVLNKYPME